MSSIKERRKARYSKRKIQSNDDLYKSTDPSVSIDSPLVPDIAEKETVVENTTVNKKFKRKRKKPLPVEEYNYQKMAPEFSEQNVPQQLFNYRCAMEYLAHVNLQGSNTDKIVDRFKDIIYSYPNVDMSSFANREQAKLHTWIIQQLQFAYGQKYLGVVYLLQGGMGLLGSMLLDTALRFENIRSFDLNGTCQFLADEFHKEELLQDWRFKACQQDIFDIDYVTNVFQVRMQDGKLSTPYDEIPGTIINTQVSHMANFQDWYNMIPDTKRVVVVGETGEVPRPFPSSQNFNLKFPMNFEQYTGVISVGDKQFFMKIGMK